MPFSRDPLHSKPSQLSKSIIHASDSIGNPFFTIWFQPAGTVREALETGNHDPEALLAVLFGLSLSLLPAAYEAVPFEFSPMLYGMRIGIIGAALGGILLYTIPALLHWTGSWLGGDADSFETRCAYGWSLLPMVCILAIGLPLLLRLGEGLYHPPRGWAQTAPWLLYGVHAYHYLENAACLWTTCLLIAGLREVHHFTWWKGAVCLALALFLLGIPAAGVIVACRLALGV